MTLPAARALVDKAIKDNAGLVKALGGENNARILLNNYINRSSNIWFLKEGQGGVRSANPGGRYRGYIMQDGSGADTNTRFGDGMKALAAAQRFGANWKHAVNEMHTASGGGTSIFEAIAFVNGQSVDGPGKSLKGNSIVIGFAGTTGGMKGLMSKSGMNARYVDLGESTWASMGTNFKYAQSRTGAVANMARSVVDGLKGARKAGATDVLHHVGAVDSASGKEGARTIAKELAPGKRIRTVPMADGSTQYRAGKEIVVHYPNANVYNKALGRVAGKAKGEASFGKKIHVISEYVTGANAGAIDAEGRIITSGGKATTFKSVQFDTIGELDGSSAIQRSSRYNVDGRRASTVRFSADGKQITSGPDAIHQHVNISNLKITSGERGQLAAAKIHDEGYSDRRYEPG